MGKTLSVLVVSVTLGFSLISGFFMKIALSLKETLFINPKRYMPGIIYLKI